MRSLWLSLLFLPACAAPARFVATTNGDVVSLGRVADDLARADVVALGELHRTPPVHETHHALIAALHERRGDVVIAMEMFERDVQSVLLQYLAGMIDEGTFLAQARPWPDYARDYRPVIEYAKANGLMVLAANAPKPLVGKVAKQGLAAVAGERDVAREAQAPQDEYWQAFQDAMKGHPGTTPEALMRQYEAQCLRDETMAESITDYLQKRGAGAKPLVVLICGNMHSNYGRGTVARIKRRMPDLDVRVVSAETVAEFGTGTTLPAAVGDYVVVAPEVERPARPVAVAKPVAKPAPAPTTTSPAAPTPAAPTPPAADLENVRPALGFMPDYAGAEGGVLVGSVREGGAAEKAGLEPGDVIVELAGVKVTDVEHYTEVLDEQKIGKTVPVRIKRAGAEVELQITVGSRPRTR